MILADKIIALRKKAGWSQEELAEQLGVSRQAVSKWEGAQSVPDMERILQMSKVFGVTTDYLLKDELEAEEYAASEPDTELHRVTMEDAARYLDLRKAAAPKMALATFLCIISAIPLLLLGAWSESANAPITEKAAAGLGLCALLLLVAVGVAIFLTTGAKAKAFAFLEKEPFETAYGVSGMVKERRTAFQNTYDRLNVVGTVLCILSVLPLFAAVCFDGSDLSYVISVAAMFLIAGIGCVAFVYGGTYNAAMQKLLEEGEYTRKKKAKSGLLGTINTCYWLIAIAIYLYITFSPSIALDAGRSWFVWPIAGVLYAAVMTIAGRSTR